MTVAQDRRIWVTMTFHDSAHSWVEDVEVITVARQEPNLTGALIVELSLRPKGHFVCPYCREAGG